MPRLAAELSSRVQAFARIASTQGVLSEPLRRIREAMRELLFADLRVHGCGHDDAQLEQLLAGDLDLNSAGLLHWLQRRRH